ncbi:PREDICTED: collagen alpha-6(VI) chain-like [Acropora digitifera]|uniref:collagen alpha-6(VI) chain-like n=1 Tax=Acropora digitifera TaxID=70779 RepID=UPI00077A5822|nr:PREDICTED: collagen alpha-6(VI) chain-like [Acropora digitifera]
MNGLKFFWTSVMMLLGFSTFVYSHSKVCPSVLDLAFMVDVSGSIHFDDLKSTKELLQKVTAGFILSSSATRVALLGIADSTTVEYYFNNTQSISDVHDAIERMKHPGGGTYMNVAFNDVRNMFRTSGRRQVPHVLVLISDGGFQKSEAAVQSSMPLKDEGIVICTLGITSKIDREQLQAIASSKEKALMLHDLKVAGQMERISDEVITAICEVTRKSEAIVHLVKENSALQGHVMLSFQARDELFCAMKCLNTVNCFSFNYKTFGNICELSHANKFTSPMDLKRDLDSDYYEMNFF